VGESCEWTTILNSAEENRANFCKILDGKPLFNALYGNYMVTLNELNAVLKVSAQAGQSGGVNKTSVESSAQGYYSDDTSQTAKMSTILVPKFAVAKLPKKAVTSHNFFPPLRTNNMDTEKEPPEQVAPRESSGPPPIVMITTTNLIRLQSNLKNHVKREYEFRNTRNGTRIIKKKWRIIQP
jgi:hypothetical protein